DQPCLTTLATFLAPRTALLILDNCEHLIMACAELAEHLLGNCPKLRILATSREPLQIEGEHQYRLAPLPVPDLDRLPSLDAIAGSPLGEGSTFTVCLPVRQPSATGA